MKRGVRQLLWILTLGGIFPTFLTWRVAEAQRRQGIDLAGFVAVSYCDLIRKSEAYDGRQIAVRATYRYGFEWQELFCMRCRNQGKTWLEFDRQASASIKFRRAPRHQGMINATFFGVFRGKKGAYGDGGYQYQFELKAVRDDKVVSSDGRDPSLLPADIQKRLCQE